MRKVYLVLALQFIILTNYGQKIFTCNCEGLVDTEYKGLVNIYDKPEGKIKYKIKHDFQNEDYLTFTISKSLKDYFKMTFLYSINGKTISGWVKKNKYFGIYPKAYSDPVRLFSKPDISSFVTAIVNPDNSVLAQILYCKNDWSYVRLKFKGHTKEGWLSHKDQCANPYTTCK